MKPSEASAKRAIAWVNTGLFRTSDDHIESLSAEFESARLALLEEVATMAENWARDVRETFPEQAVVAGMFAQKVRAMKGGCQ